MSNFITTNIQQIAYSSINQIISSNNVQLLLNVNGVGMVSFDLGPAVISFLAGNNRWLKHMGTVVYHECNFLQK